MKKIIIALITVCLALDAQGIKMKDTVFREYDIRGKVDGELCIDDMYQLGLAIAYFFKTQDPTLTSIAIGMDGRTHSPIIKDEISRAFIDSGIDVIFIGTCTTPVLYFALYNLPVDGGLMITASHNPKEYNGIKLCLGKVSVWGLQVQEIKTLFKAHKKIETSQKGTIKDHPLIPTYIDWLVDHFADLKNMKLSAVVDCGNGAAGTVLPELIKRMGWQHVSLLYEEVDGTYPNHEAHPTEIENMRDVQKVLEDTDIEIGIGLDGDCDRMVPMTKSGFLVPGDQLLALFSREMLKKHPGAGVVFGVKSSQGLIDLLTMWGAQPWMSPTGHAIIKDQMRKHGALLGGELSCHFFFNDEYFGYDDGIYAMMRLFDMLIKSGQSLDQLLTVFPKKISTPEYLIPCDDNCKSAIADEIKKSFLQEKDAQLITIDGVRAVFDYGWGIVRASNTSPKLTVRFESDSQEGLRRIKELFIEKLSPFFDRTTLQRIFAAGEA